MYKLGQLSNQKMLNIKLLIAKNLSLLDVFLGGEKYKNLYNEYKSKCVEETEEIRKELIAAIEKRDYFLVHNEMLALEEAKDHLSKRKSEQAKININNSVEGLITIVKTKALRADFSYGIKDIEGVSKQLKEIESAKKHINKYIESRIDLENCLNKLVDIFSKKMLDFVAKVKNSLVSNSFCEADKDIEHISKICDELGDYFKEEVFTNIDDLKKFREESVNKIKIKFNKLIK